MAFTRRRWFRLALTGLAGASLRAAEARQVRAGGRSYRFLHLDVFTDRPLAGNQLAVFPEPAGLDAETMQSITREVNYSETTFVFPPEAAGTDVRVRIFGMNNEMPFAGHPTIGTAFALAETGAIKPDRMRIVFGLGIGPTPVDLEWKNGRLAFAWMTQQRPTFGQTMADRAALAEAIGVDASALAETPAQEVSCGSWFLVVPLATRQAVDAAALNARAIEELYKRAGMTRRGVYAFTTESGPDGATTYSRLLSAGAREDPGTGSAAGPMGCYVVKHGLVPAAKAGAILNLQGVKVRRPSLIHMRIGSNAGAIETVKVGGQSVIVSTGSMTL